MPRATLPRRIQQPGPPAPQQLRLLAEKKTTFKLPQELYKKLKIESVEQGREMSAIVVDALRRYFLDEAP